jgi:hypothetical protein
MTSTYYFNKWRERDHRMGVTPWTAIIVNGQHVKHEHFASEDDAKAAIRSGVKS